MNHQPFVGTYRLGTTNVELYGVTHGTGGSFYFAPERKSLPRMKVGLAYSSWRIVVAILLHESFEYLAAQRGVRFIPCGHFMDSSDVYRFQFDHNDFSQIVECQGYFIAQCLPDLCRVWKKHRPK